MKRIPSPAPAPETGRKYWRSLDELAETPEFKEWLEREFPHGASEWADPVSRRHFMKIMSASLALAGVGLGATGCRRPLEKLEPFGKQPADYVYGAPEYYATARPTRRGANPIVVKSYDGRPIKIEGNAQFPGSNGGSDRWTQASILNLYDPDRARRFVKEGNTIQPEAAFDFLRTVSQQAQANGGQGLSFLVERSTSPSRMRMQTIIRRKFPKARWYAYEPIDLEIHRRAASTAFNASVKPNFKYSAAKVIVSLDCDFIGAEDDVQENIQQFAQSRRLSGPKDSMSRLYAVESLYTLTGMNADHRLRIPASAVQQVAAALAAHVLPQGGVPGLENLGQPKGVDPKWIAACAEDLANNRGQSLVVAGYRQPIEVHLLAHAMNAALGNLGKTVTFQETPDLQEGNIADLAQSLNAGEVSTLVILSANPAYGTPPDLKWAEAQSKAKLVVRLGYYEDETSKFCNWHIPAVHYLESWGDARTSDGTYVPVQPLIDPLFAGMTEIELLARVAGEQVTSPYEITRQTFKEFAGNGSFEDAWRKLLYTGFLENSAARAVSVRLDNSAVAKAVAAAKAPPAPAQDSLEVVFYRDYSVDDGSFANNGWMQEFPDPITRISWDNPVLISRKTARALNLKNEDVIEIKLGNRTVSGPVWVQPGLADNSLGLALGYGRPKAGRIGSSVGFNAYELRGSISENIVVGATVGATGKTFQIACVQHHWSMEGRPVVREANMQEYRDHPDFAKAMDFPKPPVEKSLYPNPLEKAEKEAMYQWGMAIDLNSCVGCGTCVIACQSENNIPIVGKDQVHRGREMHWIRIDRYYAAEPEPGGRLPDWFKTDNAQEYEKWIDNPQSVVQPLPCQHCEAAPCENVCPVNATVHNDEGLNLMVYNRCVGTRYCSNNCPYKVRRFNFLDFNKRSIANLKGPFYPSALTAVKNGEWVFERWAKNPMDPTAGGMRPADEWDLIKMIKNPDVTVRMRGVMEKCTYCVQRIEQAKIAQKVRARDSGNVKVTEADGTAPKTACQQACPAGAIVFGDLTDPNSSVNRLKAMERNYSLLDSLFTRPRTTYLARVRNPNPKMPDYKAWPSSFDEYEQKMGDPFTRESDAPETAGKEHNNG